MTLYCDFFDKNAAVGKLVKPPDLQSGHCGFDPRPQYEVRYEIESLRDLFISRFSSSKVAKRIRPKNLATLGSSSG